MHISKLLYNLNQMGIKKLSTDQLNLHLKSVDLNINCTYYIKNNSIIIQGFLHTTNPNCDLLVHDTKLLNLYR